MSSRVRNDEVDGAEIVLGKFAKSHFKKKLPKQTENTFLARLRGCRSLFRWYDNRPRRELLANVRIHVLHVGKIACIESPSVTPRVARQQCLHAARV